MKRGREPARPQEGRQGGSSSLLRRPAFRAGAEKLQRVLLHVVSQGAADVRLEAGEVAPAGLERIDPPPPSADDPGPGGAGYPSFRSASAGGPMHSLLCCNYIADANILQR